MPALPFTRRGVFHALCGVLIVIAGAAAWRTVSGAPAVSTRAVVTYESKPHFGGPFTLVDQDGAVRRDTDFRGKLMLIYFGNTYCRDICPIELQKMSRVMDLLGRKIYGVQPIFISFDPKRDTPARLKAYLANFHPRILGLTGSAAQIGSVARAYMVSYDRVALPGGDYDFDHSSLIFLMDRAGRHIDHFGTSFSASQIAAAVAKHL